MIRNTSRFLHKAHPLYTKQKLQLFMREGKEREKERRGFGTLNYKDKEQYV